VPSLQILRYAQNDLGRFARGIARLRFPQRSAILHPTMALDDIILPGTPPEVLGTGYGFTEGPAADRVGNVYFSDGKNDSIYYWEVGRPVVRFVNDSTDAIGMMMSARGELYVCEGAAYRIATYDISTKAKRVLCSQIDGQHFNEPNDLAIDLLGGFYFSDPNYQHHGQPTVMKQDVYYCSADGQVARVSTVCFKPNGVLLSGDDKTLYVADARGQVIYRYDVVGPGKLTNERLWIDHVGANPDGLTLDEHDNLYICCGKAGLKVFDRQGKPVGQIDVHAANCCFGGRDFRTLCIASADKFLGIRTQVVGLKPLPLRA
jgi:gluconolactonase